VVTEPDPGNDGTITLCTTDAVADLFASLGGTPDLGGAWTNAAGTAFDGSFDPATDAAGVYTYTIAVPPPCTSVSSTVTVSTVQPPNAGNDGATTLCISSPATPLFDVLGGTPQAGGTWTTPSGTAFSGSFVPGTSAEGVYTYTLAGITPCPADVATVTVSVVTEPDPGTNGTLTMCTTDAVADLFSSLGGAPDLGGVWTNATGAAFDGSFDPAIDAAGVYTYTIAVPPPCSSVSSTVTVSTVQPPVAGEDGATTLCITSPATPLFDVLGGTPQAGGTWTTPSGTAFSGSFVPGTSAEGVYTYTVAGTTPCPADDATVTVSVVTEPDPGGDGFIALCLSDAPETLFNSLEGDPDHGGAWTSPSGAPFSGIFDPASDAPGVYTYTIDVPPPCSSVSSSVTVSTVQPPNAGSDGILALCITSPAIDLIDILGGSPDAGGSWTSPTGAVSNGIFAPGSDLPGDYTYTVAGSAPCPFDDASATVSVVTEPDPGIDGSITLCVSGLPTELFNSLAGTPDPGGVWTGPTGGAFSGTFDPALDPAGVYTYTIAVPPPCSSVSSTVTVSTVQPPSAGSNGDLTVCISGTTVDLFNALNGNPEPGGTWSGPTGLPFPGSFEPTTDAPGSYTYTVPGTTPCPAASASVEVISVADVFAGTDDILNVCATGTPVPLFPSLGGADPNGSWTGPNGASFGGTLDPATDVSGPYTYSVAGTAPCLADDAVITVNILLDADAGVDGTITLCGDNAAVDLYEVLQGTPDAGGEWTDPSGSTFSGTFDPSIHIPGTYRYVLVVPAPCINDTAFVGVGVVAPVDAGEDALVERCSDNAPFDLFSELNGTPDSGGVWSGPSGTTSDEFTPGTSLPGAYTYTVSATAPCPDRSAVVTVSVAPAPDAGGNGNIALCTTDPAYDLVASLSGTPNAGGTWTGPSGLPFTGVFSPSSDGPGAYTYTVTVPPPCISVSAVVQVNTVLPPSAGTDGQLALCITSPDTPLFPSLGASADGGGTWTGPDGNPFAGTFAPETDAAGTYTYTVPGTVPCPADAASVSVTVEELPDPGTNGSTTVCPEAAPVDLFSLLGGTPETGGTWSAPGGGPSNGVFDPASDPQGIYTYTVQATAVCPDLSSSATVAIYLVSTPNAGADAVTCDLGYVLNATGSWSTGTWSGPAGITFVDPSDPNTGVSATSGGPYTLVWSVVSTDGCAAEDSLVVIFTDAIVPVVTATDAICFAACDGTASVSTTGGNTDASGYGHQWTSGTISADGTQATDLCAGTYTVTVSDMNGCSADATFTIDQPVQLVIDAVNATPEICPGSCDGTVSVIDPEGTGYSLNGAPFQPEPLFGSLCPGAYTVTMQDANGCLATGTATVGTPAPVVAGFDMDPDTLFVTDPTATFTNTSTDNAVSFAWDFGGLGTSTEESPTFTFPGSLGAEYTVCLTASDMNGCPDDYCRVVTVLDVLVVHVPNAFTPNGDGINDDFVPVFNVPWVGDYEFLIFDRWGERIFESEVPGETWDGNMKGQLVESEVYVWKLHCRDLLSNKRIDHIGHVTVVR
jgi:gliding motility-associated-like protein